MIALDTWAASAPGERDLGQVPIPHLDPRGETLGRRHILLGQRLSAVRKFA
jgi:hypothetical protein